MNINLAENVDDAIRHFEDDLLKRSPFVDRLAAILRAAPSASSNVFALYGDWGSGKTSVKNLLLTRIAENPTLEGSPQVVEFNPWAFSTQGELMHAFFDETSRAIGKAAPEVAEGLARLGAYLSIGSASAKAVQLAMDSALIPGGAILGVLGDSAKSISEKAKQYSSDLKEGKVTSLDVVRKKLSDALAAFARPVLVIIDDLDRLPAEQILQMFQLVRINASLPRINFLLLMDPGSVVKALETKGYPPEYLEKIVQYAIHLPVSATEDLKDFVLAGLKALVGRNPFDWARLDELWEHGGAGFLDTPRKIRRLLQTYRFQLSVFAGENEPEVDLVDLLGVEILRLYAPALWNRLPSLSKPLFSLSYLMQERGETPSAGEQAVQKLIELAPLEAREAAEELLGQILPHRDNVQREAYELYALRTCRLGTEIHFPSYFILTTNAAYPTQHEISGVFGSLDHPDAAEAALRKLAERYTFRRAIVKLQPRFTGLSDPTHILNLLAAFWSAYDRDASSFEREIDVPVDFVILHFTSALLRQIPDEDQRRTLLEAAHVQSGALYPFVAYLNHGRAVIRREGLSNWNVIPGGVETLDQMSAVALESLKRIAAEEKLIYQPQLRRLLNFWMDREGDNPAQKWVESVAATEANFAIFAPHLYYSSSSGSRSWNGSPQTVTKYLMDQRGLERFFILDQSLKQRIEKIDRHGLTEIQRHALDEIIRAIDLKAKAVEGAAKNTAGPDATATVAKTPSEGADVL